MSLRYIPPKAPTRSITISSRTVSVEEAQSLLASYLERTTALPVKNSAAAGDSSEASKGGSNLWNHTHDAGTTAALRKIELSMRGYTPDQLAKADEFSLITGLDMEASMGDTMDTVRDGSVMVEGLDRDEGYSEGNQRRLPTDDLEDDGLGKSDEDAMEIVTSPKAERRKGYPMNGNGDEYEVNGEEKDNAAQETSVDKEERKRRKKERRKQEKQEMERVKRAKREV